MIPLRTALIVTAFTAFGAAQPPPTQPPPGGRGGGGRGRGAIQVMTLSSSAFADGSQIPVKHTQAGEQASPPLAWSGAPDGVVSFALIVHDPDQPIGNGTDDTLHWMLWNIPAKTTNLAEHIPQATQFPDGTRQISATGPYFRGPGAASAGPAHHYVFELFALDSTIEVPALGASPPQTRAAVVAAMAGHIRGKAVLVGLFKRPPVSAIAGVVAPESPVELVREGFVFLEGPLGTADGGLLFSDIRGADRTYNVNPNGDIKIVREHTNGANGLAFTRRGELIAAEGDGKKISRVAADGRVVTLTQGSPDKPLLAPNDLIADTKGGIYFTDPGPRPLVPGRKVNVYYLPPGAARPIVIDDGITRPNGLTLTNDGKTLIVDDTEGDTVFAFDVAANGTASHKRAFAKLHDIPAGQASGADGIAIDRDDRLYVTIVTGVQVLDRTGQYLGTIQMPRQPANVAFSGPEKRTLYITAREGLYRLRMLSQGPDRLGK